MSTFLAIFHLILLCVGFLLMLEGVKWIVEEIEKEREKGDSEE